MPKNSKLTPNVSIIIPVYNDEEYLARALDGCINQTLVNIEIICVDDASTDRSKDIAKQYVKKDSRIKLIEQPKNMSALQARKVGVELAKGRFILFVDGDDEIDTRAAELSYKKALKHDADIVLFGAKIPKIKGRDVSDHEESIMPKCDLLLGKDIISNLYSRSGYKNPYLWGKLFKANLLKNTYKHVPSELSAYRINDGLITFPTLAQANICVSIKEKLYTYNLAVGNSRKKNIDYKRFLFLTSGLDSINAIHDIVSRLNIPEERLGIVYDSLESMRLNETAAVATIAATTTQLKYREKAMKYIVENIDKTDLFMALCSFRPKSLHKYVDILNKPVNKKVTKTKNVAILINGLSIGGLEGVAISQVRYLKKAGLNVTLFIQKDDNIQYEIPNGVSVVKIVGEYPIDKFKFYYNKLKELKIDAVVDHNILYSTSWASYTIICKLVGVRTIGWIHNFSLRNAHDLKPKGKYLNQNLHLLDSVITLSKNDVSYWKILGYENIYYLPNPPSPLLLDYPLADTPKEVPTSTINILWYGRLQQRTKRVYELLKVASHLNDITDNFKLSIVGPEHVEVTYEKLKKRISKLGLEDVVEVCGPKIGRDLIDEINKSDLMIYTSDIEGYPLVLTEAQAHGLPVFMYELPWLEITKNNKGIKSFQWGEANDMAQSIFNLINTPNEYREMSQESIKSAKRYLSYDFKKLYTQLLNGDLNHKEYSSEPTIEDAKMYIEWYEQYNKTNAFRVQRLQKQLESIKKEKTESVDDLRNTKRKLDRVMKSRRYKVGGLVTRPDKYLKKFTSRIRNRL